MSKTIKIDAYGIVVELTEPELHALTPTRYGGGTITSDMKEPCPYCGQADCYFDCDKTSSDSPQAVKKTRSRELYNSMMDALESMILAQACAGIDITTPAYLESIITVCQGCAKATE